jgi:CHRD domain
MKVLLAASTMLAVLLAASSAASSGVRVTTGLKASLDAPQVVPPQAFKVPLARGVLTGSLTVNGSHRKLAWQLTFTGLSGKALVAQLHIGRYGRSGPVGFQLCRPCRSGQHRGLTVSAKVVKAIKSGAAYVDVHTKKNPQGEIRGQIRLLTGV